MTETKDTTFFAMKLLEFQTAQYLRMKSGLANLSHL